MFSDFQPDGKILIAGHITLDTEEVYDARLILGCYKSDGSLDISFDNDGKVITERLPLYDNLLIAKNFESLTVNYGRNWIRTSDPIDVNDVL